MIIGAKTKEERDDWLVLMQGKILYLQYLNLARDELCRPDTRIISLLSRYVPGHSQIHGVTVGVAHYTYSSLLHFYLRCILLTNELTNKQCEHNGTQFG